MLPSRFSLSYLSIKQRLPLLIGTLLFGIIITTTLASYYGVRHTALEVKRERLHFLTQHLASLFQQSMSNMSSKALSTANGPVIRDYLRSPKADSRDEVFAVLKQFIPPQEPSGLQTELWDGNRSLVLTLPEGSPPVSDELEMEFKQAASAPLFSIVGTIRVVGDAVVYPIVAAAKDEEGKPMGYLVKWRRFVATAEGRQRFLDLIGSEAAFYIGNNRGNIWTDLVSVTPEPPVDVRSAGGIVGYTRDGNLSVIALAQPVGGTPLTVLIEFSTEAVSSQAKQFLRRMMIFGALLLAVGLAGAYVLSRSITRPLHSLTKATSAIREGDYSRFVEVNTGDEIGTLAGSFNTMVDKVRDSQSKLEQKIQDLTAQEEQYRLLFESNPLPMWLYDIETLAFLAVNGAAIHHYGYSREEFLGMTIKDIRPPEDIPALLAKVSKVLTEADKTGTWRHLKKDEAIIIVEITSHTIDFSGRRANLVMANDVTERKQAQEALRAKNEEVTAMTQQLWQAAKLAAVGELAASIAHELNNPLGTVSLRLESLMDELPAGDLLCRELEILEKEVDRMGDLVANLLQFVRRDRQQISTINIHEEIENTLNLIEYHLRKNRITVAREFASDVPMIQADRQQLRQLFLNLFSNASDAMPSGGTLTIRTQVDGSDPGTVVIEILDTGIGISPEDLLKVMEPFHTTKPEGKGTGLGLAICRRILQEHKGSMDIISEPDKGTTVRIAIPTVNGHNRDYLADETD